MTLEEKFKNLEHDLKINREAFLEGISMCKNPDQVSANSLSVIAASMIQIKIELQKQNEILLERLK